MAKPQVAFRGWRVRVGGDVRVVHGDDGLCEDAKPAGMIRSLAYKTETRPSSYRTPSEVP